jgi:hypothetical protein
VGSEIAQFPIANIQHQFTTKIARVEANTVELLIDTKVITPKDTVCLVGSSVDGIGFSAVSLYSSSTTSFTGASEIVTDISSKFNFAYKQFSSTNNRYFKLVFTGTGSTTQISKIFLGQAETLNNKGLSTDSFKISYDDLSEIASNKYGNRFSNQFGKLMSLSGSFKVLDEEDRDTLSEIISLKGMTIPFFVILDPQSIMGVDANFRFSGYFYFAILPDFVSINFKYSTTSINLIQAG